MNDLRTPESAQAFCPDCRKSPAQQAGCGHVVCPRRRPWGNPMPSGCDPIGLPGASANHGFKVRAKRGAE